VPETFPKISLAFSCGMSEAYLRSEAKSRSRPVKEKLIMKIQIDYPQVPKGAANRYAWRCNRAVARLCAGGKSVIIDSTSRLLSWRSGNLSSTAKRIAGRFERKWEGAELTPIEACKMIPSGVPGSRAVKLALRDEVYSDDNH
jgi:hypothetical protein